MAFFGFQLLNGLALAMILFLLAAGLSLVFGVARVINLAHGGFYMLGGYLAYSVIQGTGGNFWLALAAAPAGVAGFAALGERWMLRRLYGKGRELDQVLLTFGLAFVVADGTRWVWGASILSVPPPAALGGLVSVGPFFFPAYRLFVIAVGLALAIALSVGLRKTRWGAMIRAATGDPLMAASLGVPTERVFFWTFVFGAMLAGFGGVLGAPMIALAPGLDFTMLLLALVVVVVGGLGKVEGAFWSALLVGMTDSFAKLFFPRLAMVVVFFLMAVVLIAKPRGLLGRRG